MSRMKLFKRSCNSCVVTTRFENTSFPLLMVEDGILILYPKRMTIYVEDNESFVEVSSPFL